MNALGVFITYSAHVGASVPHVEFAHTSCCPAHCPQKVRSNIRFILIKWLSMGEALLPINNDAGVPHPVGSGLAELTSAGIAPRGKNQILIKSEVHSVA